MLRTLSSAPDKGIQGRAMIFGPNLIHEQQHPGTQSLNRPLPEHDRDSVPRQRVAFEGQLMDVL
jgi:hypothetical protein